MGDHSAIEWTQATWNPVTGCDQVSAGCDHCYALTLAARLKAMGQAKYQRDGDPRTSGPGFGVTVHPEELDTPTRWRRPRRIFVNSMSDLFHPKVPADFVAQVFEVMAETPQHIYQVLTKRPKRARQLLQGWSPSPNVWLGVSVEDDRQVDRAVILREVPVAVRFLSCEPLLGPLPSLDLTEIDWVIVGGESGQSFVPCSRTGRSTFGIVVSALTSRSSSSSGAAARQRLGAGSWMAGHGMSFLAVLWRLG
jgi:protein gp37